MKLLRRVMFVSIVTSIFSLASASEVSAYDKLVIWITKNKSKLSKDSQGFNPSDGLANCIKELAQEQPLDWSLKKEYFSRLYKACGGLKEVCAIGWAINKEIGGICDEEKQQPLKSFRDEWCEAYHSNEQYIQKSDR